MSQYCISCGAQNQDNAKFCKSCGQKLKTEEYQKFDTAEKKKPIDVEKKDKPTSDSGIFWWIIIIFIGFMVYVNLDSSKTYEPTKTEPKNQYPMMPMPYSGETQKFVNHPSIAPLTIETSAGANYLVKIVDYYSKSDVMTVFIKGGDTIEVKVPLGIYEIRYASGEQWYGYEHLFGNKTSYTKADSSFDFKDTGYQITGYTITLYRVTNGNLNTTYLKPSEF